MPGYMAHAHCCTLLPPLKHRAQPTPLVADARGARRNATQTQVPPLELVNRCLAHPCRDAAGYPMGARGANLRAPQLARAACCTNAITAPAEGAHSAHPLAARPLPLAERALSELVGPAGRGGPALRRPRVVALPLGHSGQGRRVPALLLHRRAARLAGRRPRRRGCDGTGAGEGGDDD